MCPELQLLGAVGLGEALPSLQAMTEGGAKCDSDYIKMEVELVSGGRGWLLFALCVPREDFAMLITCWEFSLPLCWSMAGAVDLTCQRAVGRASLTTEKRGGH